MPARSHQARQVAAAAVVAAVAVAVAAARVATKPAAALLVVAAAAAAVAKRLRRETVAVVPTAARAWSSPNRRWLAFKKAPKAMPAAATRPARRLRGVADNVRTASSSLSGISHTSLGHIDLTNFQFPSPRAAGVMTVGVSGADSARGLAAGAAQRMAAAAQQRSPRTIQPCVVSVLGASVRASSLAVANPSRMANLCLYSLVACCLLPFSMFELVHFCNSSHRRHTSDVETTFRVQQKVIICYGTLGKKQATERYSSVAHRCLRYRHAFPQNYFVRCL